MSIGKKKRRTVQRTSIKQSINESNTSIKGDIDTGKKSASTRPVQGYVRKQSINESNTSTKGDIDTDKKSASRRPQ